MSAETPPPLRVSGLTKRYGTHAPAIEGVSFAINAGEFVAVLGPSGAGKTTLFRCIARLLPPDAGSIQIAGQEISHSRGAALRAARRDVAVIFQQFNLIRRMTALENVLAGGLARVPTWRVMARAFPAAERQRALSCLDRVGLVDKASCRADQLSGGQQQRVAIARALAQDARIILADEPVASLDPDSAASVLSQLASVAAGGIAVLASLHQVEWARRYAHRILALQLGRLVRDEPASAWDEAKIREIYGAQSQQA